MIGARLVTRQSINWTRRSAISSKFHYSTTSQVLPAAATFLPAIATASSKESSDPGRSLLALGLILLASPLLLSPQRSTQPTECCGIVGVVAKPQKRSTGFTARDFLIEGLTVLKNRGYDSAGVATVGDINGKVREEVRSIHFLSHHVIPNPLHLFICSPLTRPSSTSPHLLLSSSSSSS